MPAEWGEEGNNSSSCYTFSKTLEKGKRGGVAINPWKKKRRVKETGRTIITRNLPLPLRVKKSQGSVWEAVRRPHSGCIQRDKRTYTQNRGRKTIYT